MWKFLPNVSKPPSAKNVKTKEEQLHVQRKYDSSSRKRSFKDVWLVGRPWLLFDKQKEMMTCQSCLDSLKTDRSIGSNNVFASEEGCKSLRFESVEIHEKSVKHLKSVSILTAKSVPKSTAAFKMIVSMNTKDQEKLDILFRNAHAIAKQNRPFSDFEWMCQLDRAKGLDIGKTYTNTLYAKTFVSHIALDARSNFIESLKSAKFVSVLSDGSTDSSIAEQEMFFVRYVVSGEVRVDFLSVESVEKADAKGILVAMKAAVGSVMEWDTFTAKLVGLGCDGASVMLGRKGGIAALLKQEQPSLTAVHCMAHRLELALKDAVNKCKLFDKTVRVLLLGLYLFYHNSPLNRSMLKRSFHAMDMKVVLPTRVGGTRWIGHTLRSLTNYTKGMVAIKRHLEQISDTDSAKTTAVSTSKAKCFLTHVLSKSVYLFVHFMTDVADALMAMSAALQRENAGVAEIHRTLKIIINTLTKYRTSDGPHLRKATGVEELDSVELKGNDSEFVAARRNLLNALLSALDNRFRDADDGIIKATRILNFGSWPNEEDSTDFGDDEVVTVVEHYSTVLTEAGVNVTDAEREWTSLKTVIYDEVAADAVCTLSLPRMHRSFGKEHPNIMAVLDLLATLPASSAQVERGFSALKLIKTSIRSSLSGVSLTNLMLVRLHTPDIGAYDPSSAIKTWIGSGTRARRIGFGESDSKRRRTNPVSEEVDVDLPAQPEDGKESQLAAQHQPDFVLQQLQSCESQSEDDCGMEDSDTYSDFDEDGIKAI